MPVDISEYTNLARDAQNNVVHAGAEPATATQQRTQGGTSTQSDAFSSATYFVRVHTDSAIRIAFGSNPTATTASPRMPAGATEFFGVRPGHKLAVITTS